MTIQEALSGVVNNEGFSRFVFPTLLLIAVAGYLGYNSLIDLIDQSYPDAGIAERYGSQSLLGTAENSDVKSGEESGAMSALNTDSNLQQTQEPPTRLEKVLGQDVWCAEINTDDWGYGEHFDHTKHEIKTATEAMDHLAQIGVLGDKIVVVQGSQIRVVGVDDPSLNFLANMTKLCGAR